MSKMRVLITGAGGNIGRDLRESLASIYDLVLTDVNTPPDLRPDENFIAADLYDEQAVRRLMDGIDGVIHLGAVSTEEWAQKDPLKTFQANVIGTSNLLAAALHAGVKKGKPIKFVNASTHHTVGMYRAGVKIDAGAQNAPDGLYGDTKVAAEWVCKKFNKKTSPIGILNVRIGSYREAPSEPRHLSTWISPRDFVKLVRIGLENPEAAGKTVWGISGNTDAWWDNSVARALGYEPHDNAEDYTDFVEGLPALYHGGVFAEEYGAKGIGVRLTLPGLLRE